jgi:hypothetical protein
MPANTATARVGRFQSRLSRIVDLVSSRTVDVPVPDKPGESTKEIIWTGLLYRADGKTVDSIYEWDKAGAFRNQRGVASPNDLALFMRPLSDDELKAALAKLPESAKPAAEVKSAEPAPVVEIPVKESVESEAVKDPRIAAKLPELTWNAYQAMLAEAVDLGILPANVQVTTIRGPWAELIASTLVDYLDHPETPAAPAETPKPSELPKPEGNEGE